MNDVTKLNNGAEVVAFERTCKEGGVVLAKYHGEYVVWSVSNAGDTYSGDYFSDIVAATSIFAKRAGLVSA